MNETIVDSVKCRCGCGKYTFWDNGYIMGHQPVAFNASDIDETQYDLEALDERKG